MSTPSKQKKVRFDNVAEQVKKCFVFRLNNLSELKAQGAQKYLLL